MPLPLAINQATQIQGNWVRSTLILGCNTHWLSKAPPTVRLMPNPTRGKPCPDGALCQGFTRDTGQALITCCKINFAAEPGCSCFSCFQQKTLSEEQINPVQLYLRLPSSVSTQLAAISTSATHPCRSKLLPAALEGESQSLCIVLLPQTDLNWRWWEQGHIALVSHPATFLPSVG